MMRICRHQLLKALRQDTVDLQLYQTMLNDYEQKLRYILKKNNIFIWRTDWNMGVMSVSRSLNKTEHRPMDGYPTTVEAGDGTGS